MAAAVAVTPAYSIEDYLNGPAPEPDVEYVDGELRERPIVQRIHGRLQSMISAWFEQHVEEWGVVPAVEVRTKVSKSRVRLPDLMLSASGYPHQIQLDPPLIVIEIVSPNETFAELFEKLDDYETMGVLNLWVIHPAQRRGWTVRDGSLHRTERFAVTDSPIYLDLAETFARYDRHP